MSSPDDRPRVTLARVAEAAGVSVMTASYTFSRPERVSPASRAKVLAAAEELGYAGPDPSARSLRKGTAQAIGVVLGEHLSYAFEDPQAVAFLAGVAAVCTDHGFGMNILPTSGTADDVRRVRAAAVDGFVVWTTYEGDPVLDAVRRSRRPAAVHGGPVVEGLRHVGIDNREAARAVGGAAFTGSVRPAVVSFPRTADRATTCVSGPPMDDITFPVTRERLEGYRNAIEDLGLAWEDTTVAVCARNDAAEAEYVAADLLGSANRPDAIAAMSDELAAGVVRAARRLGLRLPADLAVTGWDDSAAAAELDLTTVEQSMREQGAMCARIALGLDAPSVRASWSLVVRGSTRRPDEGPAGPAADG